MSTALFTAVSGLAAHQRRMDVIANNIANVNTTGFRGSRAQFSSLLYSTMQGARGAYPESPYGGTNPMQTGLGTRIGSIDTDFSSGPLSTTGISSDLAVQGSGFFILSDGATNTYTRDGSFGVNQEGRLVEPSTGQYVLGYLADANGQIDVNKPLKPLEIPIGGMPVASATTEGVFEGNLDSDTVTYAAGPPPVGVVTRAIRVYDSLGTPRDISVEFRKDAAANQWTWVATTADPDVTVPQVGTGTLTFNSDGSLATGSPGALTLAFAAGGTSVPVTPFNLNLDFENVSQFSGESDVSMSRQDGFPLGVLESFDFGRDGVINGVYTNGITRRIGQIALATFTNEGGLMMTGSNQFVQSVASGLPQIGVPSTGGRGAVSGGVLEGSNVDLGEEFSNMILTQRGFQANARTVTTADAMLQETVNLVR